MGLQVQVCFDSAIKHENDVSNKVGSVSQVFTDLLSNSPKRSPRFSQGYEGRHGEHALFLKIEKNI